MEIYIVTELNILASGEKEIYVTPFEFIADAEKEKKGLPKNISMRDTEKPKARTLKTFTWTIMATSTKFQLNRNIF